MPSKSKKKEARSVDSKVREVTDEHGWTHVVRGPRTCIDERQTDTFQPGPPIKGYNMALLETRFEQYSSAFKESEASAELSAFFENTLLQQSDFSLDSAICIGLGSISSAESNWSATIQRSMSQLVAFSEWVGQFKQRTPGVRVYLQDPRFNELDIEFVRSKGFEVIRDPEAIDLISNRSFLFAPMAPWDLIFQLLMKAQPALYIGNDLDEAQDQVTLRGSYKHAEAFENFPVETYHVRGKRKMPESEQYSWMKQGAINYATDK